MEQFLSRHADSILGVLNGFDRLVFRGTLRHLAHLEGMSIFLLKHEGILYKEFAEYAESITRTVKAACEEQAARLQRPVHYMRSPSWDKEAQAREIAERDGIDEGLIAVLTSVEPCLSYTVYRNRAKKWIELKRQERKCLHLYHYMLDPEFGFMHARIQSWLPLNIQICMNGREWLARQMERAGIGFERRDNCFVWIEDIDAAQQLVVQQLRTDWPSVLERFRRFVSPRHESIFERFPIDYYWTVYQSEWATDVMFRSCKDLERIYSTLVHHGIMTLSSKEVMRFLGKRYRSDVKAQVVSDVKQRAEGVRVKHRVGPNSVKMYDKQGSVLRVETTIHRADELRCYRPKEGDPKGPRAWRRLRRGVADLYRRAQLSQKANESYLQALASAHCSTRLEELTHLVCKKVRWKSRSVRALRPWAADDLQLLATIARG